LDTLSAFHKLLNEDKCNNPLMRGLNEVKSEAKNKRLEMASNALSEIVTTIVKSFVEQTRVNAHLPVEALFRFQSLEIKNSILHNYPTGL
jgi:hypothetical protein